MALIHLSIGGRNYDLTCREGEQEHLLALGDLVDARVKDAGRAVGSGNEARQLMMGALLLADELNDLRAGNPAPHDARIAQAIEGLAARIESLADRLEKDGGAS